MVHIAFSNVLVWPLWGDHLVKDKCPSNYGEIVPSQVGGIPAKMPKISAD
jgi:hypothetical protein